jgi:hypothetical protein
MKDDFFGQMTYQIYIKLTYPKKTVQKPFKVLAMSERQAKWTALQHCMVKYPKAGKQILSCEPC